ncbi:hypothetical protein ACFQZQ_04730 [Lysobacter koreensis]|uniref:Immunity protein 63 domain-containing protein n=1 Tax=Lysobacter koreensis TaxID=266122 RepID=A0ABW2YP49_9GAMM
MKLGKSSDTSSDSEVYEISNELLDVFPEMESIWREVDLEIFWVFRCLADSIERKTTRRYSKKENVLYLDMNFSRDRFSSMSKDEQRFHLSREFYSHTRESLEKYAFPGIEVDRFMADLARLCVQIGWAEEERDLGS